MLPSPPLCLITDETRSVAENERNVRAAFDGGCRWVQLRHRRISTLEFHRSAERLRVLCDEYASVLIVNDRVDVAVAVGADGVHLPAAGITPRDARTLIGADRLVGLSVHSTGEISASGDGSVDYFQFGPVFDTASKRAYGAPQGLAKLRAAVTAANGTAVCAVGGITSENITEITASGASAVAIIGAIHAAGDAAEATSQLLRVARLAGP